MFLKIEHSTRYHYARPVEFTPHRLRMVPRSFPDLRIVNATVAVNPEARVRWGRDAEENPVGSAVIVGLASELLIESRLILERPQINPFDFVLEERGLNLPLSYTATEIAHLAPYLGITNPRDFLLREWLSPFLSGEGGSSTTTLSVLIAVNGAISNAFRHVNRHDYGVRTPHETISLKEGTCRDFAFLLMESARSLGIAARYVSGYLCGSYEGGRGRVPHARMVRTLSARSRMGRVRSCQRHSGRFTPCSGRRLRDGRGDPSCGGVLSRKG